VLYAALGQSDFKDTILIYSLSLNGKKIGEDFVDQAEYNRRKKEEWLKVLWTRFSFELLEKRQALILGTESINASKIFSDPTVGFRCCATASP
jgi:hypothetical protein